jgi:hypothetical protein
MLAGNQKHCVRVTPRAEASFSSKLMNQAVTGPDELEAATEAGVDKGIYGCKKLRQSMMFARER